MTQEYQVTGMTCGSCKAKVETSISTLPDVTSAIVDLEKSKVTVKSGGLISLASLQGSLPSKFTLSEELAPSKTENPSELKQLFPLFLIFGYITTAAIMLNASPWSAGGLDGFMLDFMGLFYIVFSFFKLLDLKGFPKSFRMYDPLAKKLPSYGWIYPFIEVVLGIMFLKRIQTEIALIATIIILGITTIGVTKTLLDRKSIQCACLGTALKLPMTKATFIENSIMLVMAIAMLTS